MPADESNAMLSVREAARRLSVRPATVRTWIREGRLEAFRRGRVLRVPLQALCPELHGPCPPPLDAAAGPRHTAPDSLGGATPMYVVRKYRRRDRGRPWVLWWYEPPGGVPVPDRRKVRRTIGRMSERLAERHRQLWQAELNGLSAGADPARGPRWAAFRDAYRDSVSDLAPATRALYRQALARLERILRPRWLADVDRAAAERYRAARAREVGPETVRKDLRHLRAAWSWALAQEMVPANPWTETRRRGPRARSDPDALSAAETRRFLVALESRPTWVWASLRLACLWGPRTGELAEIRREDLDLAGHLLQIPARAGRRAPKGGRGRVVPLDAATAGLLQECSHREGPILWGPEHTRAAGTRGYRKGLVEEANAVLEALALPRRTRPVQMLRRTAETNMRRRGVPDWQVGRVLGHGTGVGEQFYAGLAPEEIAGQVARAMRGWVAPRSPPADGGEGPPP